MEEVLSTAIRLAPFIQQLTHGDGSVAISDREKYLHYASGKLLDFKLKVGQPIPANSAGRNIIDKGGGMARLEMPADVFGFRYVVHVASLHNAGGDVVGTLLVGFPLTMEDELGKMAVDLASAMQEFAATFESIAEVGDSASGAAATVEEAAGSVKTSLSSTLSMAGDIARIADRTRLLGLNASIEAAHAGRTGAGFAVVAREIQTLAEQSNRASQQMSQVLSDLAAHNQGLENQVGSLRDDALRLQTALSQAQSYVERLAEMADALQTLATRDHEK